MSNIDELQERVRDAGEELHSYLIHYAIDRNPHRDHPALKYKYEADIADADAVYMQYVEAVKSLQEAEMKQDRERIIAELEESKMRLGDMSMDSSMRRATFDSAIDRAIAIVKDTSNA